VVGALAGVLPELVAGTVPAVGGALLVGEFLPEGVEPCGCAAALDPEGLEPEEFDAFPGPVVLVDWVIVAA